MKKWILFGMNQRKIHVSTKNTKKVAASRSHSNTEINNFLEKLDTYTIVNMGSSLKFCLIANGEIDIYPRSGPTSEWDTAAGEAILKSAGGSVIDLELRNIVYNKENLLNPNFIAANNLDTAKVILDLINYEKK